MGQLTSLPPSLERLKELPSFLFINLNCCMPTLKMLLSASVFLEFVVVVGDIEGPQSPGKFYDHSTNPVITLDRLL